MAFKLVATYTLGNEALHVFWKSEDYICLHVLWPVLSTQTKNTKVDLCALRPRVVKVLGGTFLEGWPRSWPRTYNFRPRKEQKGPNFVSCVDESLTRCCQWSLVSISMCQCLHGQGQCAGSCPGKGWCAQPKRSDLSQRSYGAGWGLSGMDLFNRPGHFNQPAVKWRGET